VVAFVGKKVVFCTPTVTRPYAPYLKALEDSVPLVKAAGWEDQVVFEIGNPYISAARAKMTRKALDAGADVIVYLDHDLSWEPKDLVTLLETEGDVVAGTYRMKYEFEDYMGTVYSQPDGRPVVRPSDGAMQAKTVPAGFLKVTKEAIDIYMTNYPDLCYGPKYSLSVDLFNHGAHKGLWWGEDYAFARRWNEIGGQIWLVPNLCIDHHTSEQVFKGNFHEFMMRQPGGSKAV
jgi:glycosyltransferase involved in cell wall biosynthesis